METSFGNILRDWRKQRRMSQLVLGLNANVSSRHISFIESGRSKPSREMVLNLAGVLQISKAQTNLGCLAAGFAPVYENHSGADSDLSKIHHAVSIMLENHLPYPAIVLDNHWNVKQANKSAQRFLFETGFSGAENLVEMLIGDTPQSSSIENWHESVTLVLQRLKVELFQQGQDVYLSDLVERLSAHLDANSDCSVQIDFSQAVIPTRFKLDGQTISVFSTVTQFGSVFDIALAELKIELMFPADKETEEFFRSPD